MAEQTKSRYNRLGGPGAIEEGTGNDETVLNPI